MSVQVELYKYEHGEYGEGVNTADCGSVMLGFESLYSPHILKLIQTIYSLFFWISVKSFGDFQLILKTLLLCNYIIIYI